MAQGSTDLKPDSLGGVRFADADLERRYYAYSLDQSLAASRYTPWIAAALFLVSAPFDYVFVGGEDLTLTTLLCLGVRAVTVLALVASGFLIRVASARAKSVTLIIGWAMSVLVIWFIAAQAAPLGAVFYTYLLGLASLSTISLVPVLSFWQVRAMNLFLIVPFLSIAALHGAAPGSPEGPYFAFSALILASTIFMGLYSKRSYELALRNDFLRSLDLVVARDRALLADRAKSDFLAAVSHELRTPLNAILGNLQLLAKSSSLSANDRDMLGAARKASGTMIALVDDLLRVSSTGRGRAPASHPVRIGTVIEDVEAIIGVLAAQKSVRLEMPPPAIRSDWTLIDADGLRQILLNLLGNAVKFTHEGRVGLRLRLSDARLSYLVFDTGIGMDPDQVGHAFDPLFRGTNVANGDYAGTGLGLAIVDRLARERGGAVRMRSRPGKGTVVLGWLPATATAPPCQRAVDGHAPPTPPMRILVIEDDPANRAILTRMLTDAGHSVLEAGTGAEAVDLFAGGAPDCVLSDIRLPDTNGIELLKTLTRLSQSRPADHVPFYAVTANALPEDLIRYEDAGFDGVIGKPFEEGALAAALGDIAVRKRLVADLATRSPETHDGPDARLEQEMLYLQSMGECLDLLRKARAESDAGAISDVAHRVLGTALTCDDPATAEWARKINDRSDMELWRQAGMLDGFEAHLSEMTTRRATPLALSGRTGADR